MTRKNWLDFGIGPDHVMLGLGLHLAEVCTL